MDAVPLSFHIITLSSSFEDAIRLALSHGGDGGICETSSKIEFDQNDHDQNDHNTKIRLDSKILLTKNYRPVRLKLPNTP